MGHLQPKVLHTNYIGVALKKVDLQTSSLPVTPGTGAISSSSILCAESFAVHRAQPTISCLDLTATQVFIPLVL